MDLTAALDRENWADRRRIDVERGVLVGSRCPECGHRSWPSRSVCSVCGSAVSGECELSRTGRLLGYTRVSVPRPGIPAPYVIGLIELDDGVRLHAHVRGLPEGGATVPRDVVLVVPETSEEGPAFWFDAGDGNQEVGGGA
jgi:uncharacterized OB-fold protein